MSEEYKKERTAVKGYRVTNYDFSVVKDFKTIEEVSKFVGVSRGIITHALYKRVQVKDWFIRKVY